MSPTFLSTLALLFLSYTHDVNASWSMSARTLLTARMDPLVSPNGVASVSFSLFFHWSNHALTRVNPILASMFTT